MSTPIEDAPQWSIPKDPDDLPRTRQSKLHPDCRSATESSKYNLPSCRAATIIQPPRPQIPILIVARFSSRLSRYMHGMDPGRIQPLHAIDDPPHRSFMREYAD